MTGPDAAFGFVTVTELQERLNIERRQTITDRLRAERIRTRSFGQETLVAMADIVDWIKAAPVDTPHPKSRRNLLNADAASAKNLSPESANGCDTTP